MPETVKDLMVEYPAKPQEMKERFWEMRLKEEKLLIVVHCVPLAHALQDTTEAVVAPKANHRLVCQMIVSGRLNSQLVRCLCFWTR
jgi:hypothetical protein